MSCTSLRPSRTIRGALRGHQRVGFTLVELLVVMAILGVLAGLLAWGVNSARVAILKRAQAAEIANIATAVEAYRTKYGDYPPDGSSWPVMEAHLRKAFPNIIVSELQLLNPSNSAANGVIRNDNDPSPHPFGGRVFDPAEALVFFLGGFSSDPQRPISGPGGPLKLIGQKYFYNTQRENAFFEFNLGRLTIASDGSLSNDEQLYNQGISGDLMPVFVGSGPTISQGGVPIVYFDSRTYQFNGYLNSYVPGNASTSVNCARPAIGTVPIQGGASITNRQGRTIVPYGYANSKTYQLVSAGYDKFYGFRSIRALGSRGLIMFQVGGGKRFEIVNGFYYEEDNPPTHKFNFRIPNPPPFPPYFNEEYSIPGISGIEEGDYRSTRPLDDNLSNYTDYPTFVESQ
jgi:prepilin-type N-terminal cleavage/methylation domain-containing protein